MKGMLEFNLEDAEEEFAFKMASRAMDLRYWLLAIDDIARKGLECGVDPLQALTIIRKITSLDSDIEPNRVSKEDVY